MKDIYYQKQLQRLLDMPKEKRKQLIIDLTKSLLKK
jgi:hypothetical protein